MPYEVIWEPHGAVKRFWGHISDEDIQNAVNEVCGDYRFDALRYVLNDFTDVESQDVSSEGIDNYAAERIGALQCNPHIISPFVACTPSALAIVRAITSPQRGTRHAWKVFSSMTEARKWLATFNV